ncbi:MAG: OstA-like protein, partial [Vulcanimicrobiaceae bacterium]
GNFGGLSSARKASSKGPSTLTTDKLQINGKTKTYIATGNVHFTQADSDVTSDHAVLDDLTHTLTLDGNVKMSGNGRNLVADHVVYNTISGQAHATGNVVLQFASNVHPITTPKPIVIKNPLQKTKSPP